MESGREHSAVEIVGRITDEEVIASGRVIREVGRLRKVYGLGRWRKMKGIARAMRHAA